MENTTSREKVLKSIRNAMMSKLDNPYQDVDFESPVYAEISDSPEIAFAQEFIKVDGKFVYCSDDAEFAETLKSVMVENSWNSIHCLDKGLSIILKEKGIMLTSDTESFDNMKTGLTRCEYLIARLGSVMVSSAHTSGRRMNVFHNLSLT